LKEIFLLIAFRYPNSSFNLSFPWFCGSWLSY